MGSLISQPTAISGRNRAHKKKLEQEIFQAYTPAGGGNRAENKASPGFGIPGEPPPLAD